MSNQKGFSPIIIIVVVVVIAIGGVLLLSKGSIPGGPVLPGLTQRATEADFAFIEDENLRKHFVAQSNQTTYRTKTYSDAADLTFVMEIEVKGESFNTRDVEYQPADQETRHKIQLGDAIYVKDYSDNKWWKQTLEPLPEETPPQDLPEEEEPKDFKEEYSQPDLEFKFLGKEACGPSAGSGLTCFKYEQLNGGPEEMAFNRIFWFDDQKYLLRKEETTVGEFGTSVEYSYDGINLVPPSPTKDVPTGKSIYDYYYGYGDNQAIPAYGQMPEVPDYEIPEVPTDYPTDFPMPEDFSDDVYQ